MLWVELWVGIFAAIPSNSLKRMAGTTGLEPAASAVTGQRSNQLNYVPTRQINKIRNRQCLCGFARFAYRAPAAPDCPKERDSCPNRPQAASKFGRFLALLRCAKPPAQRAPGDPDCSQPGQNRHWNVSRRLAQKYPNSFSQNTKGREAAIASLAHRLISHLLRWRPRVIPRVLFQRMT
jgi:hypothetical protein